MKVALVHDYIKEYGGAERVLEALHEIYPDATVFTSVYLPGFLGPHRERFKDWKIKTSWFQHVPFNHKLISPFRLVAPWVFQSFDFSEFDVVIVSSTGAYFPNMIRTRSKKQELRIKENNNSQVSSLKSQVHICYCHTPPRYLYGYATAREWKKHKVVAALAGIANHFLRMVDYKAAQNVDYFIANSEEVASRIKKFYRKDSKVIYPPVDISIEYKVSSIKYKNEERKNTKYLIPNTSYYLTGGRLARAKHVDLIVRACSELEVPLKVFGKSFAGYGEELREMAGSTVEFLGEVSDKEKAELMAGAKAFLFASEDEDFGIIPVEAMGYGLPVIAHYSGGVKETVLEGQTGMFFEKLTVESLENSIKKFEKMKIKPENCRKQAEKFSKERFQKEIKEFVGEVIKHNKSIL